MSTKANRSLPLVSKMMESKLSPLPPWAKEIVNIDEEERQQRGKLSGTHLANVLFDITRFGVPIWILKRVQAQRGAIQVFVFASIYAYGVLSGVGLCNSSVLLHANDLGPDFVVDRVPLVDNFLDVIL